MSNNQQTFLFEAFIKGAFISSREAALLEEHFNHMCDAVASYNFESDEFMIKLCFTGEACEIEAAAMRDSFIKDIQQIAHCTPSLARVSSVQEIDWSL